MHFLIQSDLMEALFFLAMTWVLASDWYLYHVWLQRRELGVTGVWRGVFNAFLLQMDKAILKAAGGPSPPCPKGLRQQQLQATSCLG